MRAAGAALAGLSAPSRLDSERSLFYADLVYHALSEAARKSLEELMANGPHEYRSDFALKYIGLGEARGEAKGLAQGLAKGIAVAAGGVITILEVRGLPPSPAERARILAVGDLATLERWMTRARKVDSVARLFDDAPLS